MLFAQFELQIPDEAKQALQDNPQLAAEMIRNLTWLSFGVLALGGFLAHALKGLLDAGYIDRSHAARLFVGIAAGTWVTFLVVAGYSQTQYAWMTAIIGAIVGYYFRETYRDQPPPPAA